MRKTSPKKLLAEFRAAQASEMKVFEARQKAEIRELDASIKSRRKEWEKKERDARHHFFDTHPNGPDRRAYIHDFLQRRQAYVKSLKDEREKRLHDQDVHRQSLRMDQASRLLEFQDKLNMGELPPSSLWPSVAGQ